MLLLPDIIKQNITRTLLNRNISYRGRGLNSLAYSGSVLKILYLCKFSIEKAKYLLRIESLSMKLIKINVSNKPSSFYYISFNNVSRQILVIFFFRCPLKNLKKNFRYKICLDIFTLISCNLTVQF